jgi:hypothetical protein
MLLEASPQMRVVSSVALLLPLLAACGGSPFTTLPGNDSSNVSVEDAGPETELSDTSSTAHVTEAGPVDAGAEAVADAVEAGADVQSEAATEGGLDAHAEAAVDGGSEEAAADGSDAAYEASGDGGGEACTPITFYQDGDSDGYGGTTTFTGCSAPAQGNWATKGGDCDDSNATVNPGQSTYFDAPYVPTGKTTKSFDYNCDGQETESGNSPKASCQDVALSCIGSGYVEASPVRSGAGVDAFCGSVDWVACAFVGLTCTAGAPEPTSPIACH